MFSVSFYFFCFFVVKTVCWWQSIRPLVVGVVVLIQCCKTEGEVVCSLVGCNLLRCCCGFVSSF